MPLTGPQQFDLTVFDTFQTKDPAMPISGVDIAGTVGVTVNWNLKGTELTAKGVEFDDPRWQDPGDGPLPVFDDAMGGGLRPIGNVAWSVETHALKKVESDTPNRRQRWAVTPVIQLIRTLTPCDHAPAQTVVAYTASETVRGEWMAMA